MIVSFEEYEQKKKDVDEYNKKMRKTIDQFILSNKNFIENHKIKFDRYGYYGCVDFYRDSQRQNDFVVKYYDTSGGMGTDEVHFSHKEYLELLDFFKNLDAHIDSKKYNL